MSKHLPRLRQLSLRGHGHNHQVQDILLHHLLHSTNTTTITARSSSSSVSTLRTTARIPAVEITGPLLPKPSLVRSSSKTPFSQTTTRQRALVRRHPSAAAAALPPLKTRVPALEFPLALLGSVSAHVNDTAGNQTDQPAIEHGMVRIGPFRPVALLGFGDQKRRSGILPGLM